MNSRFSLLITALLALALLLGGCSAAKLTNSWKQESYTAKSVNMLVIGVSGHKARRQIFEATLTKKLNESGIKAIASYRVFEEKEIDAQTVIDYAKQENIDSVIVTKVLDTESYNQRVSYATGGAPGYGPGRNPYYGGFNGWHDDYRYWQTNIVTYDTNYQVANLEANLYQIGGDGMVWSALVEVESVENDKSGIKDLTDLLVKQMRKDGLF